MKNLMDTDKVFMFNKYKGKIMSNFEIKDNEIVLKGLTENGESVLIELKIEELMHARNEYIKHNKEYIKKSMADLLKILFS